MRDPQSSPDVSFPDTTAYKAENGFLFSDWETPEKNPMTETPYAGNLFDGKIIARMPDLGTEFVAAENIFAKCTVSTNEQSTVSLCTKKIGRTLSTFSTKIAANIKEKTARFLPGTPNGRQQYFIRLTAIGCVVLLCGIAVVFIERGNQSENIAELTVADSGNVASSAANDPVVLFCETSSFVPIFMPEMANVVEVSSLDGNVAGNTVPPPAAEVPTPGDSVWNRSVADSYSVWDTAARQARQPETAPADASTGAVPMTSMVDMSMPVSPFEQQLLAQSNLPIQQQVQQPVDPFQQPGAVQPMGHTALGTMPSQYEPPLYGQQQYVQPQYVQPQGQPQNHNPRPPTVPFVQPQYVPASAIEGMHPPFSQHNPQTAPMMSAPAVPAPMASVPQAMAPPPAAPIPSGVSTLPMHGAPMQGQGGFYPQQQPHGHYYNPPPRYRGGLF